MSSLRQTRAATKSARKYSTRKNEEQSIAECFSALYREGFSSFEYADFLF